MKLVSRVVRDDLSNLAKLNRSPFVIRQSDLFAGGGGATTGSQLAYCELRKPVQMVCVNHNEGCVNTQALNHPAHVHLCTGVDRVSPSQVFGGVDLHALWASPVCTHFSQARGGTPVNPQLRATMWQVVRWVRAKRPIVFWVENVPEVLSWGRLRQMRSERGVPYFLRNVGSTKKTKWIKCFAPGGTRPKRVNVKSWWAGLEKIGLLPALEPDPRYNGETIAKWQRKLRRENYDLECRVLNCADHGSPTTRRRIFFYGVRRDSGYKIVWPKASHAQPDDAGNVLEGMEPWVPVKTCIDWSHRGQSIFERDRPLSAKTIKRIVVGLIKYGLNPFLVPSNGSDSLRVGSIEKPMHAICTNARGEAVVSAKMQTVSTNSTKVIPTQSFIVKHRGTSTAADVNLPAPAITAGGTHLAVVEVGYKNVGQPEGDGDIAFLTQVSHGVGKKEKTPHTRRVKNINDPMPVVTGSNDWAVTQVSVVPGKGGRRRSLAVIALQEVIQDLEALIMKHALNPKSGRPTIVINGERIELEIFHRMMDDEELAKVQSFPPYYRFFGNKTERIKQIGNAVPPFVARALVKAFWTQNENVGAPPKWNEEDHDFV